MTRDEYLRHQAVSEFELLAECGDSHIVAYLDFDENNRARVQVIDFYPHRLGPSGSLFGLRSYCSRKKSAAEIGDESLWPVLAAIERCYEMREDG
jgi:hypothetical protein